MYTLIRSLPPRQLLAVQAPAILCALIVAELFYKLGSFTLECGAFLATWAAFDYVLGRLRHAQRGPAAPTADVDAPRAVAP
jgi:hypothetical protein